MGWQENVTLMIKDALYIIVDNQKIPPIERSPRPDSATGGRTRREEQPFGVVDRVTISSEAREKASQYAAHSGVDPPAIEAMSKNPPTITLPLLTYSPKQLR